MIFAAIFAVLSTAAYAVARTVFVWPFLRVGLGLSLPVVQGREEQALNQVSRNVTYKDSGTAFGALVWRVAYCFIAPYRHFINRYIWIDGSPFDTYTTEPKKV